MQAFVAPDLLHALDAVERERILSSGLLRKYRIGETVFAQGEPHNGILVIRNGEVRAFYVAPSGREITLAYWHKGHFVGGPEILGKGRHTWSGEATRDSELLLFASDTLRELALSIPQFAVNLIEGAAFKAKCFSALLQLLGTRPATVLISQLLIVLAKNQGTGRNGEIFLESRYTQDALAKMVGATRQWVALSLKRMRREGLLDVIGGRIVIRDLSRLEQCAGAEDAGLDVN
jgi:CRP/FNR family cyclic AMP-dependent transcriptional regulator